MSTTWPELSYPDGRETFATLHLWTQVVGKIRLAQTPWLNHSWHVPLYVTARGLTSSLIPHGERLFELEFDFNRHVLHVEVSDGASREIRLQPRSVADFYAALMQALSELRLGVSVDELPCEIAGATRFSQDESHTTYDAQCAQRLWRVLLRVDSVFKHFRTGFLGKCSPVHFFWGSFDLAVTRFSGRPAPAFPGKAPGVSSAVMSEAYSHEVSSAGFWPGGGGVDYPCFYSYTYPTTERFRNSTVEPKEAAFDTTLGEFLLPYEVVRQARDPDAMLMSFLQSTYAAAAKATDWDAALECAPGAPGVPRPLGG
jgi:Family of unknown function (DUF5996)